MARLAPLIALGLMLAALAPGGAPAQVKGTPWLVSDIPSARNLGIEQALALVKRRAALRHEVAITLPAGAVLTGRHFGAVMHDADASLAEALNVMLDPGVLVFEVASFTPAAEAGIVPGDIVVAVDGVAPAGAEAAGEAVLAAGPGGTVTVEILRFGAGTDDFLAHLDNAARAGEGPASMVLGELAYHNFADRRRYAEAEPHYRAAWEHGDPLAAYRIGTMYHDARGVSVDLAEATRWFERAAAAGLPEAEHALALLHWTNRYWTGEALVGDAAAAVRLFGRAAEQGHAPSYHYLGQAHEHGYGVAPDRAEARRWYEAALESGDVRAGYSLGQMMRAAGDDAAALGFFRAAAEAGDVDAARTLGDLYSTGEGVPLYTRRALDFYRIAAGGGDEVSMLAMAEIMVAGYGVPRDTVGAAQWYFRAYQAGNADAGYALAYSHADGLGVERDFGRAAGYLLEAVRRGSAIALEQVTGNPDAWDVEIRMELQRLLAGQGLYEGAIDGIFGPGTLRALEAVAPG